MRIGLMIILFPFFSWSQISQGSNYFFMGNDQNEFRSVQQNFPIDTTAVTDSATVGFKANASLNVLLGYQVALLEHWSVGILTRLQSSKESTYKIGSIGPSVRYHFGFDFLSGPKKVRLKSSLSDEEIERRKRDCVNHPKFFHYFTRDEQEMRLKSLFFLEGSAMFGSIRADGIVSPYSDYSLMTGILFRFPRPDIRIVRNFGFEISLGARRFTQINLQDKIAMNVKIGLIIFSDRKYTQMRSVKRPYVFEQR